MSELAANDRLLGDEKPKTSPFLGMGIALMACFGFGVALVYQGGASLDRPCDQPLAAFLVSLGVAAIVVALVYLIVTMASTGPSPLVTCAYLANLTFAIVAIVGAVMYTASDDCALKEPSMVRWVRSGLLACVVLVSLMVSTVGFRITGPALAIVGHVIASVLGWIADLFHGLSFVLTEHHRDASSPDNAPLVRDWSAEYVLLVTHAAVLWLFVYMVADVAREWHRPCDGALHTSLLVLGVYGSMTAFSDFLFEKFAAERTRRGLKRYMPYVWIINIVAWLVWGAVHTAQTLGTSSCKHTSKDVYKVSMVLSVLYLLSCGLLLFLVVLIGADYLWSGRVRVVVVFEANISRAGQDDLNKNT